MPTSTTPVDSRAAITRALQLVAARSGAGPAAAGTPGATSAGVPMLPTHKSRAAIDYIATYGSYDALEATRPPLRAMFVDALGWNGDQRVTKVLNKALVAAMSATTDNGNVSYAQAAEMVSYLSLCAPLLEPDRLARIAALAAHTPNAYKPIRYIVTPAAQLRRLLARYNDQRREDLLASLWVTAHDGRWWDATAGAEPGVGVRRRRRKRDDELPDDEREAIAAQLRELMGAARGAPNAEQLCKAFDNRLLTYSRAAATMLNRVTLTSTHEHVELQRHGTHPDADVPVLLSFVPHLLPDERPESPIPALIDELTRALGEGIDEPESMPARPAEWAELFPAASREDFPMPKPIRKFNDAQPLPGAIIHMMTNADRLKRNADHMGNCTFGYKSRSEQGRAFIGHLEYLDGEYNFAIDSQYYGYHQGRRNEPGQQWFLGEVNSRFNRGAVPDEVIRALDELVATLQED